jgi:single-stranded-DNA-specific exonuclease
VADRDELDYALSRLAPVGSLENVDAAVDLLIANRASRITVIGDFDVDGATSATLMMRCLREFGFTDVGYLVPNRFEFGYGLTPEIVRIAADSSPALLVTVDNGISSLTGVEEANRLGIPVLITDHHLPGSELPDAAVIVNPNLPGSSFPSRNLAGVGVAFYLMAALGRRLDNEGMKGAARVPSRYLDVVALGTVADVVPLDHNNRVLVDQGLRRIRAGKTVPGIEALLRQSGRQLARTTSADLGFVAGPRINAAGRLEDISIGIECLLTDDMNIALHHAAILDQINGERREIESTMREQAFAYVDRLDASNLPACVCVYDESWHQGVVGLIAARVRERCYRPSIAFARESDALLKGSARSIQGVHVRDLLEAVHAVDPELIVKFGARTPLSIGRFQRRDRERRGAAGQCPESRVCTQAARGRAMGRGFSGASLERGFRSGRATYGRRKAPQAEGQACRRWQLGRCDRVQPGRPGLSRGRAARLPPRCQRVSWVRIGAARRGTNRAHTVARRMIISRVFRASERAGSEQHGNESDQTVDSGSH